ncbi:MAG TPA: hypothetical protein PKE00_10055 [Planctomycetota bacterium]|nr:hypothetical protein [Planctomycetota bacterium]
MQPLQEYSGVVLDAKRRPVAGARLGLRGQTRSIENSALQQFVSDSIQAHTESDSTGRFAFHVLPIRLQGLEIEAETPDGGHEVELDFAPNDAGRKDLELEFEVEVQAGPTKKGG